MASNFLEILSRLHDHHVEFVIVGGVAASLHGSSRVTFDLDVVPNLVPDSWQAAVDLLWSLGARPRIPEPLNQIRDVEQIRRWKQDKGMLALNFRTPDGSTEVDLLVSESDQFEALHQRAVRVTIAPRTKLPAWGLALWSIGHQELALITLGTLFNVIARSEFETLLPPRITPVAYEIGQRCRIERLADLANHREVDVAEILLPRNRTRSAAKRARDLAAGIELPDPPPTGALDIQQVLSSSYFFA